MEISIDEGRKDNMKRKLFKITACYFIFLGLFLQSCASPTKIFVALKNEKISTLKKVGIISVYKAGCCPAGLVQLAFHKKAIDAARKTLQEASPELDIREGFAAKLTSLLGIDPIRINENEPEAENIKEIRGRSDITTSVVKKLDYSPLKDKFNIDHLIVLETYNFIETSQGWGQGDRLSLTTHAALIDLNNNEIIWHKVIATMFKRKVGRQQIYKWDVGCVDCIKRANSPQIVYIVDELIKDFEALGLSQVSSPTEGEKGAVSPENLSQEQIQPTEAPKDSGIISITTDPPGAKIFMDGEFRGLTPAEVSLMIGTHQLFLQLELYKPYQESVSIEKGQTKTMNIRLSPAGGEQR
jgi:hypothetical protein